MVAEKLTKRRLTQIILMMLILLTAFTWRTVIHSQNNKKCQVPEDCQLSYDDINILFRHTAVEKEFFSYTTEQSKNMTLVISDGEGEIKSIENDITIVSKSPTLTLLVYVKKQKKILSLTR